MKKVFYVFAICALLITAAVGTVQADVSMWFTDSAGNSITELVVAPDATFTIQAWMNTTTASKGFALALGYDTAISMGTSAVVRDNKLALATGVVGTDVVLGSDIATLYPTSLALAKAGMRAYSGSASNSVRPYGIHIGRSSSDTGILADTLIASISLKNLMSDGEQYDMVIWNANTGSSYTSMINVGTSSYPRTSDILTIKSASPVSPVVPEPSSMIALGSGVLGLFGFLRRRRS